VLAGGRPSPSGGATAITPLDPANATLQLTANQGSESARLHCVVAGDVSSPAVVGASQG
jgi:hypothetical protein